MGGQLLGSPAVLSLQIEQRWLSAASPHQLYNSQQVIPSQVQNLAFIVIEYYHVSVDIFFQSLNVNDLLHAIDKGVEQDRTVQYPPCYWSPGNVYDLLAAAF